MAQLQIEKISNATISVNGTVIFGGPNEVKVPDVKAKTAEYSALGMLGTAEYFAGFEKMEGTIKFNHYNQQVATAFGDVTRSINLQVRTNKEKFASSGRTAEVPLVYKMTATPKSMPGPSLKAQEMAEFEIEFSVTSLTIEENGVEIWHFDATNNSYRVNGVSVTTTYNSNLGI